MIKMPKFKQIKDRLVADIEAGLLRPGVRIESESELMQRYGVARMTVVRSLNELVAEGYLVRMKGKGTFVRVDSPTLPTRKLAAFALVIPGLRDGFFPSLIKSFSDAAGLLNYQILTCNTDNAVEKQGDTILQLIDNGVPAVAILPTSHGTPPVHHLRQLQANGIPVVQLHRDVPGVSAPLIGVDYVEAGRMAGCELAAAGHRRVALFGTHQSWTTDRYALGLRGALESVGGCVPEDVCYYGQRTGLQVVPEHEAGIEQALRAILAMPAETRPTAIFSTWDSDAELIILVLNRLNVRVPDEMSLITIGGAWRGGPMARQLTAITFNEENTGNTAVRLLDEMLKGERPIDDPFRSSVALEFFPGATLQPPASNREAGVVGQPHRKQRRSQIRPASPKVTAG
jgi:GntR family transcriptional regulator of arabinose operon